MSAARPPFYHDGMREPPTPERKSRDYLKDALSQYDPHHPTERK